MMVEMFSKCDPVLKECLMRLKHSICKFSPSVSYLAQITQNKFINVLTNRLKEILVMYIKSAGSCGLMFGNTHDI